VKFENFFGFCEEYLEIGLIDKKMRRLRLKLRSIDVEIEERLTFSFNFALQPQGYQLKLLCGGVKLLSNPIFSTMKLCFFRKAQL
jgi:hypothetical protein